MPNAAVWMVELLPPESVGFDAEKGMKCCQIASLPDSNRLSAQMPAAKIVGVTIGDGKGIVLIAFARTEDEAMLAAVLELATQMMDFASQRESSEMDNLKALWGEGE